MIQRLLLFGVTILHTIHKYVFKWASNFIPLKCGAAVSVYTTCLCNITVT